MRCRSTKGKHGINATPPVAEFLAGPVLNTLPQPVLVVDPATRVRLANEALHDLCNSSTQDVLGQPLSAVLTATDGTPGPAELVQECLRTHRMLSGECEVHLGGAGREKRIFAVQTRLLPVGAPVNDCWVVLYLEDVTHRLAEQQQLIRYQRRLQRLAVQLAMVESRERRSIAAELHDRIGQVLSCVQIRLGVLRNASFEPHHRESLDRLYQTVNHCIDNARMLIDQVSTPVLYGLGLVDALESLARNLHDEYGLSVTVDDDGAPKPLSEDLLALVYQSISELLLNVVKHARTNRAHVALRRDGNALMVSISDPGVGFNVARAMQDDDTVTGFGLFGIRERFVALGGSFSVDSRPGKGTRCSFTAPLIEDQEPTGADSPV